MNPLTIRFAFTAIALLLVAGCVRVDSSAPTRPTVGGLETDQALAIVIDTSGSFESDWEAEAYDFSVDLIDRYFRQSLGSRSVLQLAVLSETSDPVFWVASPRDFARAFPNEEAFRKRLADAKQTEKSPIFRSVIGAMESAQATAGLRADSKVTVVVLSDLKDNTQPRSEAQAEAKRMAAAIKAFTDDGGNIAFYYASSQIAISLRKGLNKLGADQGRYWIESANAFAPTPPNFY